MTIDFNKMDGYEFENYIASLLREIGFRVEETALSGDGRVDLIAYSDEVMYKGEYLVQCKRWDSNFGVSVVRDLYGVVLSNNANKGIIITNAFFTSQAIEFSEGKNMELVDGDILNSLVNKYLDIDVKAYVNKKHFTQFKEFDNDKYKYLKQLVDTDQRNKDKYIDLFGFLYSYITNKENLKLCIPG